MRQVLFVAGLLAVFSVGVRGQEPDGTDIATAIPIYFGQIVSDIGDVKAAPAKVYAITLARGQRISADASNQLRGAATGDCRYGDRPQETWLRCRIETC